MEPRYDRLPDELVPANEAARLAALEAYKVLDTPAEENFDHLVHLAAEMFSAPIALISLVHADRQWFKARRGVADQELPRSTAFCAHTILQEGVCLVPDATADPRFADNPLVTGTQAFRFYAGAPLTTAEGHRIGSLCVLDRVPRSDFGPPQQKNLERLAALVMDQLELRVSRHRLEAQAQELADAHALADTRRRQLQDLIDRVPIGVTLVGPDLRIAAFNRASQNLLDLPTGEKVGPGRPLAALLRLLARRGEFGDQPAEHVADKLAAAREGRPAFYERTRSNGSSLEVHGVPVAGHGYAFLYVDVTDQRRRVEAQDQARQAAERASALKSEFLANMSHEIRTPMNGILGMNALLLDTDLDDEQKQYAVAVRDSAEALLGLINDILDISKLEAAKVRLEHIPFDLEDVVHGVLEMTTPAAVEKGLSIGCCVDERLARDWLGDPTRLRQVLMNLVGNAVKFTESGSVEIRATPHERVVTDGGERQRICFEIRDTGIGLTPEARERLFDKFTQADSSVTRRYGGTGLGLALARSLVELMGGEIGVDSEPGRGSIFWFTILLGPSELDAPRRDELPDALRGLRALVIDDIVMNRRLMRRMLEREGLIVDDSEDAFAGYAAIERAWHKALPYDLIVLDQMMPGMAGDALAARLRADPRLDETRLILATSAGVAGRNTTSRKPPRYDAVLSKPVRRQSLVDVLRRLFAESGVSRRAIGPAKEKTEPFKLLSGKAVLVCDDNQINQRYASTILRKDGAEVETAADGAQAVNAAEAGDYDLVLMDVQMPVMDGLEATRRIRRLPGRKGLVPIIGMTAHAMPGDQERCIAAGMSEYLAKPVDIDRLRSAIGRLLSGAIAPSLANEKAPEEDSELDDAPLLDDTPLNLLGNAVEESEIRALVRGWIEGTEQRLDQLSGGQDHETLQRVGHDLAGTSGTFGARRLSLAARRLEAAAKDERGELERAVFDLKQIGAASIDAMKKRWVS